MENIKHLEEEIWQLDLKVDALDADIKSLKKAARQNVSPEIIDRIEQIIETGLIELKDDGRYNASYFKEKAKKVLEKYG